MGTRRTSGPWRASSTTSTSSPPQTLSPLADHVPAAPGGEFLVLELLLQTADLHVLDAFAGAHPGGGADEAGELVGGEEDLLHHMDRLHVGAQAEAVADHSVDQRLVRPGLPEELRGLPAVLVGPLLEVDVVEEARAGLPPGGGRDGPAGLPGLLRGRVHRRCAPMNAGSESFYLTKENNPC